MRATGSIQNIMETTLETIKGSIDANTIIGDPIKTDTRRAEIAQQRFAQRPRRKRLIHTA